MENKYLTVMNLISGAGEGGAAKLSLDICKGLKRRGHRVIWACYSNFSLMDQAIGAGFEIYDLFPSGAGYMTVLRNLIKFCKDNNVDILNSHHSRSRHLLFPARFFGLRTKIVSTRHCIASSIPFIEEFYNNFLVDLNIAVSNAVRKSLIYSGIFPKKTVTIYGGVDIERFEKVPQDKVEQIRQLYTKQGVFNIGIIARFDSGKKFHPRDTTQKGFEILFRALGGINANFNLLVLGPIGEKNIKNLKMLAEHNGLDTNKIICCGFQKDIAPFYKIIDLTILPSSNEALGLVLIESMAAGTPCIGTNSGGISEIITDGADGFLFKQHDSNDLADKIRKIMENKPTRDAFIIKGREKAKKMFPIEKTVYETESVFYSLLRQKSLIAVKEQL